MKLSELQDQLNAALSKSTPDIKTLNKIRTSLQNVPIAEREAYRSFIDDLQQSLFDKGIELTGSNFNGYFGLENKKSKSPIAKSYNLKAEFNDILKKMIRTLSDNILTLKNYFLLNLSGDSAQHYDLLIVHDDNYFIEPFEKDINSYFPNAKFLKLNEISNPIEDQIDTSKNYLALLLLETKKGNPDSVLICKEKIEILIDSFEDFSAVYLQNYKVNERGYYNIIEEKDKSEFTDEVQFVVSSFLTNIKLSNDEEKIIKKLLESIKCPLLEYKILVKGFSGADVIEVKPKRSFATKQSRRYILKYSKLDKERKLKLEDERFHRALSSYEGFRDYSCMRVKTKTHEGLRYEYAKTDFVDISYPFSEVISDNQNKYHGGGKELIERLHQIPPFEHWLKSEKNTEETIFKRYEEFVKPEKTKKAISKILNLTLEELEQRKIMQDFNQICEIVLQFKIKICHGDLHTNNFFVDEGIYLIDFGLTDVYHSLIDYSCLEASIKFNHFPRYLSKEELNYIEDQLLDDNIFNASYKFDGITRKEILYLLDLLHENRLQSKKHILNNASYLEYYISLYFMTVKQVRYNDMNQLYAIESMRKIGDKIIKSI